MSKTLFWYIFWNLFRIFALATATLAGMMSFAGLLRPLTENGLDFGQVNRMLLYMMPAMATYSLPVAALFATTMVYGRFSADNELTAMRAGGISYLSPRRFSIALPAVVLGLIVAVISLVMLCFVVPIFSLKIEQVIYSNIARVIQNKIERVHEVDYPSGNDSLEIYADSAHLIPPDPAAPALQRVRLIGPAMMRFGYPDPVYQDLKVPKEFFLARDALITVDRAGASQQATLTVSLTDGIKFPREFFGNEQVGIGSTGFGPIDIPSGTENVKFLNVTQLAQMATDPGRSQEVQIVLNELIIREQAQLYLKNIWDALDHRHADGSSWYTFDNDSPDSDTFQIGNANALIAWTWGSDSLTITAPGGANNRSLWLMETHGSQQTLYADAKEMRLRIQPVPTGPSNAASHRVNVTLDLYNVRLRTQEGASDRASFARAFSVPMTPDIVAIERKSLAQFIRDPVAGPDEPPCDIAHWHWQLSSDYATLLHHNQIEANNAARSELHSRASFAMSCLSLVMVGCALGVTFKSGNFLNAFAASFVPAILCITLIICGQQVATHVPWVPWVSGAAFHDPLDFGLGFIWIGNFLVFLAAIYLTVKLQRR